MNLKLQESPILKKRPYQKEAIVSLVGATQKQISGVIENKDQTYDNSALIEMATGSGKTFTVGKYLDLILKLRNRENRKKQNIGENLEYVGLNVLVLTNIIDGLNQFRDDLVHGRENKDPIISSSNLENIKVSTFHSKADNLDDIDPKFSVSNEDLEEETFSAQNGRKKDNIFFSTYQTARLKEIENKIPYFDIIIIDEAHNVKEGNNFKELIDKLSVHGRDGKEPLIIPITATPTNLTEVLFGDPIFSYTLAEYLASEYSPNVEYNLIAKSGATLEEIEAISRMIEDAKNIKDIKDKKELLKTIKEKFEEIMIKVPNLEELVSDLLSRLIGTDNEIKETIIYAGSIEEADKISQEINKEYGENIALAYHSETDRKGLEKLKDPNDITKIVIAVDMLNESIDLPVVSNIVFWRGTNVARIYLQQFGRGLRGDGLVKYYDYVCSMKNFSWIGGIYESFNKIVGKSDGDGGERESKFQLLGGNTGIGEHQIDLSQIGFDILKLEKELELKTLEDYQEYFKENIDEFETFGCKFNEKDGKNTVDLNNIGNPGKFNLFGLKPQSSLKNLSIKIGNNDEKEVTTIPKAQSILKLFFESMGYKVDLKEQEKIQEIKTLEDYQKYFKENIAEFKNFGCEFNEKDGKNTVDLNNIGNPGKFNLFGLKANSSLKNLSIKLGNNDEKVVTNITKTQIILKLFFGSMGYEVDLKKEELKTLEDYQKYFKENIAEFETFGCKFDEKDGKNTVDLNNIGMLGKFNLFGLLAVSSLRNLNIKLGNNDEKEVKNIPKAQSILKQFFESMGYKVDLKEQEKIQEIKTLEDYQKYFKKNTAEFETFGCKFNKKDGKNTVDLNNIGNPGKFNLFGLLANSSLRNLSIKLGNNDEKKVENIPKAQSILKLFFESMGYEVDLKEQEEKEELKTLEDYQKYFKKNIAEFETFGCKFNEKDGKNTVDLNNIGNPGKFNLFGLKAASSLKNLSIKLGNNSEKQVENIPKAQSILKQFFKSMGYEVDLKELKTLEDYKNYFKENIAEFEAFGCKFNEKDGKNTVDLNNIENLKKFNLFGLGAQSSLKKLSIKLGNNDEKEVKNIPKAQSILKLFFESMGYNII